MSEGREGERPAAEQRLLCRARARGRGLLPGPPRCAAAVASRSWSRCSGSPRGASREVSRDPRPSAGRVAAGQSPRLCRCLGRCAPPRSPPAGGPDTRVPPPRRGAPGTLPRTAAAASPSLQLYTPRPLGPALWLSRSRSTVEESSAGAAGVGGQGCAGPAGPRFQSPRPGGRVGERAGVPDHWPRGE